MQASSSTHQEAQPRRQLLVLVDGPFPGLQHERAALIAARAQAADVLVVAPALPVPGERWIIDLEARRAQAGANLRSWSEALAGEAESVQGEIGDESPRLAVADALEGFAADEYLDTRLPGEPAPARQGALERVRELFSPAPTAPGLRAGHA